MPPEQTVSVSVCELKNAHTLFTVYQGKMKHIPQQLTLKAIKGDTKTAWSERTDGSLISGF